MPLTTCPKTMSLSTREQLHLLWTASLSWTDHNTFLRARREHSGKPLKMTWTLRWICHSMVLPRWTSTMREKTSRHQGLCNRSSSLERHLLSSKPTWNEHTPAQASLRIRARLKPNQRRPRLPATRDPPRFGPKKRHLKILRQILQNPRQLGWLRRLRKRNGELSILQIDRRGGPL